jgi:hypothetical protein
MMVSSGKLHFERRDRRGWKAAALKAYLPARLASLTTETAAAATRASAAAAALPLGTGFIHIQCTSFEIRAVQGSDSPVGFFGVAHLDKRKATRAAGITIRNQIDTIDGSITLENRANRRIGSGKIQIAYKNILQLFTLSVFQLCGQDEADQDSQALAGLSKGPFSLARISDRCVLVTSKLPANRPPIAAARGDRIATNAVACMFSNPVTASLLSFGE